MKTYFNYKGHRFGPAPIHWNSEPGICRWCGCCILKKNGEPNFKHWHQACFKEFSRLFWPDETRRYLLKTRGEKCQICGKKITLRSNLVKDENGNRIEDPTGKSRWLKTERCEHHHIIPLIDYIHSEIDPWAAWRETNLILLCHSCHMDEHRKLRDISSTQLKGMNGAVHEKNLFKL